MVCIGSLRRALVLRAAGGSRRRLLFSPRALLCCGGHDGWWWRGLRAAAGGSSRMMLDSDSAAGGQGQPQRRAVGVVAHAQDGGAGGYASGGWAREDGKLKCGYSSFRGKRSTMEDFYDVKLTEIDGQAVSLFGVFDGETYQKTDTDFLESESNAFRDDGSTASTAVLVGGHLYVANVGDSRAVISKAGKAMALSEDHKPNRSDERKRIENAGGVVIWAGTWRVGGVLAMSRAFGNRLLKPFVVAEPEIQEEHVNGDLECLVLASDGLWDVVENEEAVILAKTEDLPESAARKLTEIAYSRGSADNITCIVVQFHHDKTE
uniref:protein-serine/threonine phosphatase n=2 Tax=Leersia perrieri TaxID=77586 RepID=A0A0D9VED3_9ORYZ